MAEDNTEPTNAGTSTSSAVENTTGSTMELSKGEMKKLAKKAEKAAKKAQQVLSDSSTANTNVNTDVDSDINNKSTSTNVMINTQPPKTADTVMITPIESTEESKNNTTSFLKLVNMDPNDSSTIKSVWSSLLYQVALENGGKSSNSSSSSNVGFEVTSSSGLHLVSTMMDNYGNGDGNIDPNDTILSVSGKNSIALAISYSAASTKPDPFFHRSCFIDEWCEWERTALRPSIIEYTNKNNIKPLEKALQYLNQALVSSSSTSTSAASIGNPFHLVGTETSIADICVVSTLAPVCKKSGITGTTTNDDDKNNNKNSVLLNNPTTSGIVISIPPAVSLYFKSHLQSYENAVTCAQKLHQQQVTTATASSSSSSSIEDLMKEPCLCTVVSMVFESTIKSLYEGISLPENIVKQCQNPKHGDYQCSAAMPVFAALKQQQQQQHGMPKNPPEVGAAIVTAIGVNHPILMDLTVQGPGFVICKLRPSYLQHHIVQFLKTSTLPFPQACGIGKTCVVDFSSPNIAKEMHVGHLRSTIIGECVCRILEAAQYNVHRINHVGDWGTQFGMLIQYLREEYPNAVGTDGTGGQSLPNITDLTVFYKNAKERFDSSPEFKKKSQTNVVDLQAGDPECLKIWTVLCDISRLEFEKVYKRLDVNVTECGESFYNDKIPAVIDEFVAANKVEVSDGAKCVFVDKMPTPLMLQKSDGGYGYDSTDMAALKYRLQVLKADRIVYITDFTQSDHFKLVFSAGKDIGWLDNNQSLEHIGFGTVQGEDGKRFKTRSGDTVRLVDLLDEAVSRMEQALRERIQKNTDKTTDSTGTTTGTTTTTTANMEEASTSTTTSTTTSSSMSDEEIREVAEAIGYGAVKYFDLRRNPTSNYKFSYDQMLSTVGDTAVYLLYARVRLDSIISKAGMEHNITIDELIEQIRSTTVTTTTTTDSSSSTSSDNHSILQITQDAERNLAFQLLQFADVMTITLNDLYPFHICDYLYKLATSASDFVTQCRVLDSNQPSIMKSRLLLCYATSIAMNQCFQLLGIRHVKRI